MSHTAFHTGCTNLYSHQVCTGVSSSEMSNNHFLVFYTYHILSYSFHHCPISVRLVVPLIFIRSLYSVVQQKVQASGLCHTEQTVPQRSHSAPTVTEGEARACSAPCTRSAPLQVQEDPSQPGLQPCLAVVPRIPSVLGWLRDTPSSPSFKKYFLFKLTMDS